MQTVFHARCARLKWSFRFVRLPASRQCEGAQLQILGSTHPWTAAAKLMPLAMLLGAAALGWRAALAPSRFALLHRSAPPPLMLAASDTDQAKRALVMETARSAFLFADTDASGVLDREEVSTLMQRMMTVSESNDVDDLSDSSAGGPDPLEVTEADLIKEQADLMEEVEAVFAQYSHDESGDLTYEDFLLLLSQCSTETALFNGLLCFAEGAVSAGVQFRFSEVSAKESLMLRTLILTLALTLSLPPTLFRSPSPSLPLFLSLTRRSRPWAARGATFWTTARPRGGSRSRRPSSYATTPAPER